jgi:hypothetical protein
MLLYMDYAYFVLTLLEVCSRAVDDLSENRLKTHTRDLYIFFVITSISYVRLYSFDNLWATADRSRVVGYITPDKL